MDVGVAACYQLGTAPDVLAPATDLVTGYHAVEPLGAETLLAVETHAVAAGGTRTEITARLGRNVEARVGDAVRLHFDPAAVYLFDPATGAAIPGDR